MEKRKTVRNIIIFVIVFNLIGWLAYFMAESNGNPETRDLAQLIWLAAPFLTAILLRLFSKDWKDTGLGFKFGGNIKWYLFSLIALPVLIVLVVLAGSLFGGISLDGFDFASFIQILGAGAAFMFIKNIFEEFSWRGFLTPKLDKVVKKPVIGHLITGLIWGTWHIPYYLGLLDKTSLGLYTSMDMAVFIPLIILGITLSAILFGELRLITGSTWPGVIMHTVSNLIIMTLLVDQFITVSPGTAIFFTPSWEGLLMMVLITLSGLWLYTKRKKQS